MRYILSMSLTGPQILVTTQLSQYVLVINFSIGNFFNMSLKKRFRMYQ